MSVFRVAILFFRGAVPALLLLCTPIELRAQDLVMSGTNPLTASPAYYGLDPSGNFINLADATGATTFYNNGIFGQNTTSWVVDAQLVDTSLYPAETFSNLAYTYTSPDAITTPGEHATWVAALLGNYSSPGYYLNTGLAPLTTLGSAAIATSTNSDGSFNISASSLSAYAYAAANGDVVSTSVGDSTDNAGIGQISGVVDSVAAQYRNTTIVAAAGNSGPTGLVGGPASGYNVISVGALDGDTDYTSAASFSSVGPLPTAWTDGTNTYSYNNGAATRPGVDILAPGSDIVMPVSFTISGSSVSFSYYSLAGTSFATPLVAAGASLLDSTAKTAFNPTIVPAATESVVIKAVLMNSADKLAGWNNGQQMVNGVITTTQALDYTMGAGAMDLNAALTQYTTSAYITTASGISSSGFNLQVANIGWAYGTVILGGSNDYTFSHLLLAGEQIGVTAAWLRSQTYDPGTDNLTDIAQAELDLKVYQILQGGNDVLVAESNSPVSTTQELYFQLQNAGDYMIEVDYSTNLFDFSGSYASQDYGLAWSVIPEPGTNALLLLGGAVLFLKFRRRGTAASG